MSETPADQLTDVQAAAPPAPPAPPSQEQIEAEAAAQRAAAAQVPAADPAIVGPSGPIDLQAPQPDPATPAAATPAAPSAPAAPAAPEPPVQVATGAAPAPTAPAPAPSAVPAGPTAPAAATPEVSKVMDANWPYKGYDGPQPWQALNTPELTQNHLMIGVGAAGPEVVELAALLGALGYGSSVTTGRNPHGVFDDSLAAALQQFCADYGAAEDPAVLRARTADTVGPWLWETLTRAVGKLGQAAS